MALDRPIPDPPSLGGHQPREEYEAIDNRDADLGDDYRREELAAILADGAWADAFEEWAAGTGMSEADFEVVVEHGLIDEFDFYWDASTDEVGYRSPTLSEATRDALDPDAVDDVEADLDTLGRVTSEVLENDYLLRDDEQYAFFPDDESENAYGSRDRD